MDKIKKAIDMMVAKANEEDENFSLEDGDLVGVFNDAVIVISLNDNNVRYNIIAGAPDKFDYNLDLLEEKE